jgi:Nif-specific regulatory protein
MDLQQAYPSLIGSSAPMLDLFRLINRISDTDITVLIQGESGTGKELVAKAIHEKSKRKDRPFIKFNCAALPESLIETELFGHEKGAFTGAETLKLGRFELANHGTIFFDEIGELSLPMQVKLLRILQEQEFERVGGVTTLKVDVRIIAATNQHLDAMMSAHKFREDLYFRLNRFPLKTVPLRERGDDVVTLAEYFLKKFSSEYNVPITGFTDGAISMLKRHIWQGNVRELQNVISRAVIMSNHSQITETALGLESVNIVGGLSLLEKLAQDPITEAQLVKLYAQEVHRRCGGNKRLTCETLGLNYRTLMARLD